VKESDRIATTALNLRAMGADVEEFDDGLRIGGPVKLRGAKIDPHGDHRSPWRLRSLLCWLNAKRKSPTRNAWLSRFRNSLSYWSLS